MNFEILWVFKMFNMYVDCYWNFVNYEMSMLCRNRCSFETGQSPENAFCYDTNLSDKVVTTSQMGELSLSHANMWLPNLCIAMRHDNTSDI